MANRFAAALVAGALLTAAGCGGGGSGITTTSVNPGSPSYSALQLAVGTANLYGSAVPALNVVSTFRQTNGNSATGVNTPTIVGPFSITVKPVGSFANVPGGGNSGFPDPYTTVINGGPSIRESGRGTVFGTPQTVTAGAPACDGPQHFLPGSGFVTCPSGLAPNTSTFGQSGGVFGNGIQPANYPASQGVPYSLQPYLQPFFNANNKSSKYQFIPYGGPPAFDPDNDGMGTRDGGFDAGADLFGDPYYIGIFEGITVFDGVKVRVGSYSLNVAIATAGSGGTSTSNVSASAHLASLEMLPLIKTPVFKPDGNGGGSFDVTLPARVTDAIVQIVDFGPKGGPNDGDTANANCQGPRGTSFSPVYYTVHVTASGTYTLSDSHGPNLATSGGPNNLKPSPSVCTAAQNTAKAGSSQQGDDIVIQAIGFDYPGFSAAHSFIENQPPQKPAIANGAGRADITIGFAFEQDNGSTTQQPALARRPHAAHFRSIHR